MDEFSGFGVDSGDGNSLNFNVADDAAFEPTDEQLDQFRADLEAIADGVRPHLVDGFSVTTRLAQSGTEPHGVVVISFPTGEAIGPSVPITAEQFEGADEPDWTGPIPPEEIETMSRRIASVTVAQWSTALDVAGNDGDLPAK